MIPFKRIIRDYEESGAVNALVGLHAAIDEHTFLTKGGDLIVFLRVQGVDDECLDHSERDQVARQFESAMRIWDEKFRIYQYLVKRDHPPMASRVYEDPIVREAAASRTTFMSEKADSLSSVEIYFAIAYEGWHHRKSLRQAVQRAARNPQAAIRELLSTEKKITVLDGKLDAAREVLANKVNSFVVQLGDSACVQMLDKVQAFRFVRRLLNYAPHKAENGRLRYDEFVDYQAADSAIECYRDYLKVDNDYVQVLTLKDPPSQTSAHQLKGLQSIPSHFIACSEWKPVGNARARSVIQSKRRHFHNSETSVMSYLSSGKPSPGETLIDDSAAAIVSELGGGLEELEVNGHTFGQFSMTIVLYDQDRSRLKRSVAECFKVFATHDAQLIEERFNLLNAFLAVIPGNHLFNLRRMWLLNTNHADLSFLFCPYGGETLNAHLGAEHLAVLETNLGTPYFLNLHHQDVAHTLVLGATGSGKSFLLNFLVTNLQKYAPRTFVFDLGGSYESLTRLFGGAYVRVGAEQRSFSINPFSLPMTPENVNFQFTFVRVLVESSGYPMTVQDERDLFEQIENVYAVEPAQRRLFTLANVVNRNLRAQLHKWVEGGQYGSWFDNVEDNLTFARFQTFDFEGMDRASQVREALLFYILHRANAAILAEEWATTLKVFVIDEAWRFFRHPTIKLYIVEALKTWRKKNAAMILATQSSDDLLRSEMLSVVAESCPTKMFLANPGMDRAAYREVFHLNETEADLIARLAPKQQILVKRPDIAKVLNLNVDRKGYWLYTNNPYDNQKKNEAFERYGFEQGLEILARSNPS